LKAGLNALPQRTGAAIFLLADQPQIPVELVQKLVALHAHTMTPLVAPRIGNRRGNPVLFDRSLFPELSALQGDQGGRALFSSGLYPVTWLDWQDDSILLDIDTWQDYRDLLERKVTR
jgi:molybdenum cofactor cytidylyltransferase